MSEALPFLIVAGLLDAYASGRALLRHHGVPTTLFWLMVIWVLPLGGALLYLGTAAPYLPRRKAQRRRARILEAGLQPSGLPLEPPHDPLGLFEICLRLTQRPATRGNQLRFLGEGPEAFGAIEAALAAAQRSIWVEYYIIKNDETGGRFLDLLITRAQAGVEVRLLYDAVGSLGLDAHRLKRLRNAGGRAEAFLPVNPLRRRWSVHLRNHRKIVVVDGRDAFTGGMNVGDEYSGRARRRGEQHFHDAFLALNGPVVQDLASVFAEDWAYATDELLPLPELCAATSMGADIAVLASGPDQQRNAHALAWFTAISTARKRLWLTSPYFIPDAATHMALVCAALRGVDVRIQVPAPQHMDVRLVGWASRGHFAPLLQGGVRIFEYQASMLHAKTLVVDDLLAMVGSANVDIRSMHLNFEASAITTDATFMHTLGSRFLVDLGHCTEVTLDALESQGLWRRLGLGVARLMSPLL